jgi:hypothetical protein
VAGSSGGVGGGGLGNYGARTPTLVCLREMAFLAQLVHAKFWIVRTPRRLLEDPWSVLASFFL